MSALLTSLTICRRSKTSPAAAHTTTINLWAVFVMTTLHNEVLNKFIDTDFKALLFPPITPKEFKLVEDEKWPGERRFVILSKEILKLAVELSKELAKMQAKNHNPSQHQTR